MAIRGRPNARWLLAADAAVAAVLVVAGVLRAPDAGPAGWTAGHGSGVSWTVAVRVLAVAVGLPVAVRRRRPTAVLAATVLAGAAAIVAGLGGDVVAVAVGYALYPVGLSDRRPAIGGLVAALAGVTAAGLAVAGVPGLPLAPPSPGVESFATTPGSALLYSATIIAGSWLLARAVRARRAHASELADLRAARAVAEERLRIARDIHDVVGHNLSLIAMKAAVANHVVDRHPDEREAALRTIERVSRAALDDVRAVLGALRDPADDPDLGQLVEQARSAGVAVTVDRVDLDGVPAAVRASAHRIVQEALTNVRRHAGPTRCRLTLAAEPGALTVAVVDDGPARADRAGPPGYGLAGMRERVALHGGTLHTGTEPGGGFAVRARLPYRRPDEQPAETGPSDGG